MKDITKFKHNHDINYQIRSPKVGCNVHCLWETGGRISEGVLDNTVRASNSYFFKHSEESWHQVLDMYNYKIIKKGYKNNARKREIAEELLIKEKKPAPNK